MMIKNEIHRLNCERWEFIRNFTKEEYAELGYKRGNTRGWYRCKVCGKLKNIQKSAFKVNKKICDNNCHGFKYAGYVVTEGNCIAATHPHFVKYFVNEDDVYKYSAKSNKKVLMKCIECGYEKHITVGNLTNQGFQCNMCSDGIPYPEKFIGVLLRQAGVEFKTQISLDDGKHKYDFYLPKYNAILETHGVQHYEQSSRGRSLKEEQENDKAKMELALNSGYRYIVIDARNSELEWMKTNIMNSELPILLGFSEDGVDWLHIEEKSRSSLVNEVCEYFANNETTTCKMRNVFGLSVPTIITYLKQGTKLGWCNYKPQEGKKFIREAKPVRGVHKQTGETVTFPSVNEAGRWLGKSQQNIASCCIGKSQSAYGYTWTYVD